MPALPLLTDLEPARKFQDGDRVIARVSCNLRLDQRARLTKTILKFARAYVRVWVVDCRRTIVTLTRNGQREPLVTPLNVEAHAQPLPGKMNLSLAVVQFMPGDILEIRHPPINTQQRRDTTALMKEWAGDSVDVRLIPDTSLI